MLTLEGPEMKEKLLDFNREYYRKYYFENKSLPTLDKETGSANWGKPPEPEPEKKDDDEGTSFTEYYGIHCLIE